MPLSGIGKLTFELEPENYAKKYAEQRNIPVELAKAELAAIFSGKPSPLDKPFMEN